MFVLPFSFINQSTNYSVLPKRQKLIGLAAKTGGSKVGDDVILGDLKVKAGKKTGDPKIDNGIVHNFILMGTPVSLMYGAYKSASFFNNVLTPSTV